MMDMLGPITQKITYLISLIFICLSNNNDFVTKHEWFITIDMNVILINTQNSMEFCVVF